MATIPLTHACPPAGNAFCGITALFALAAVLVFLPVTAHAEVGAAYLQKRFAVLDSALLHIPRFPEVRTKEVEPVNGLFRKLITQYPEVVLVLRTNAKGIVVNDIERQGKAGGLHANVSDSVWYTSPKKSLDPWFGPLVKENRRSYLFWSVPLTAHTPLGGDRFVGVVAIKIDIFDCFKDLAAQAKGPFEILLNGKSFYYLSWTDSIPFDETDVTIPGNVSLGVRMPKTVREKANQKVDVAGRNPRQEEYRTESGRLVKVEPAQQADTDLMSRTEDAALQERGEANGRQSMPLDNMWLILASVALLLAVTVGGAFFVGRRRARKSPVVPPDAGRKQEVKVDLSERMPAPDGPAVLPAAQASGIVTRTTMDAAGMSVDEIVVSQEAVPLFDPSQDSAHPGATPEPGLGVEPVLISPSVKEEVKNEFLRTMTEADKEELARAARDEVMREMRPKLETELREALKAEITGQVSTQVRVEIEKQEWDRIYKQELEAQQSVARQQIIDKEVPLFMDAERLRLSKDIKEKVAESDSIKYEEEARTALRAQVARKLLVEEADRIRSEELEKLRASLTATLAEEEAPKLAARIKDTLTHELRQKIEANERDVIREGILAELKASIREELLTTEHDRVRASQLERLERELYSEIVVMEKEGIRKAIVDAITREERTRVESEERREIIENERNRLLAKESPALREKMRLQIRNEEMQTIREAVKSEIYSETVQVIRAGLEEKYASAVQEELAGMKEGLGKKVRTDLRTGLQQEYRELAEGIEQLSALLAKNESLQSLGQTVTLLSEEKKKYKYFNLNAAQTESLLDYLRRVHSRFTIYLDMLDKSVRELMLKLGSVKTKLDSEV